MEKMVRRLAMVAVAVALVMAVALPAGAGAVVEKMKGFYTSALQGNWTSDSQGSEGFQWVYCSQATRIVKPDGSAVEEYQCELTKWIAPPNTPPGMGPDLGPIFYPKSAMRFEDETGAFYFSDFLFLNNNYQICFADTWREQLTPSGEVHFKAYYSAGACDE